MDNNQYKKILEKLDKIINLLALNAVRGLDPDRQIEALTEFGFQPSDIAPIVGRTPNAVRIALHEIRTGKRKPAKKTGNSGSDKG
jgi:hypothetical protein